ncbi:MAG: D-alanine--D-alanine ligase [Clostridiales bacterium]|jgi:D-alanine-D-alanine ligase|nr:D-alanine--D-alanine ligase [Clostridiales bacterium]
MIKNVLVLFGGCSPEHDISKESVTTVLNALNGNTIIPVYITRDGKWLMYDGKLDNITSINWEKFGTPAILSPDRVNRGLLRIVSEKVKAIPIDVVFPVLHGPNGEDGTIQGLCELAGIPYVGCNVAASAVAMDKAIMKLVAKGLKIPQAEFLVFGTDEIKSDLNSVLKKIRYKIGYPCFVKPAVGGSSIGISKAPNRKILSDALQMATDFSSRIVIEKTVEGREIEVGVLGAGMNAKASVPGEILSAGEFYDFEAKYENPKSKTIVPANLPEEISAQIQKYALDIFRAIGGSGLSRVDFFVDVNGRVIFNEINTVPGFTAISMYMKMWEASGIPRNKLVENLIEIAVEKYE